MGRHSSHPSCVAAHAAPGLRAPAPYGPQRAMDAPEPWPPLPRHYNLNAYLRMRRLWPYKVDCAIGPTGCPTIQGAVPQRGYDVRIAVATTGRANGRATPLSRLRVLARLRALWLTARSVRRDMTAVECSVCIVARAIVGLPNWPQDRPGSTFQTVPQACATSCCRRYCRGVTPVMRRNARVKCAWSE